MSKKPTIASLNGKDKRIKLTPEQKEEIKKLWIPHTAKDNNHNQPSEYSIKGLARAYNVSPRLISSIVKNKPIKQKPYKEKAHMKSATKEKRQQYHQNFKNHIKELKENQND